MNIRIARTPAFLAMMLLLGVFSLSVQAQQDVNTIIKEKTKKSFTVVPQVKLSSVGDRFANFVGLHGGLVLNHKFLIGLGGYGLTNVGSNAPMGYGGLILEYFPWSDRVVHVSFGGLIGAGGVSNLSFFVAEPEAKLNVNVTPWFRLSFGGGYRFVSGAGFANPCLRGPVATFGVAFGR